MSRRKEKEELAKSIALNAGLTFNSLFDDRVKVGLTGKKLELANKLTSGMKNVVTASSKNAWRAAGPPATKIMGSLAVVSPKLGANLALKFGGRVSGIAGLLLTAKDLGHLGWLGLQALSLRSDEAKVVREAVRRDWDLTERQKKIAQEMGLLDKRPYPNPTPRTSKEIGHDAKESEARDREYSRNLAEGITDAGGPSPTPKTSREIGSEARESEAKDKEHFVNSLKERNSQSIEREGERIAEQWKKIDEEAKEKRKSSVAADKEDGQVLKAAEDEKEKVLVAGAKKILGQKKEESKLTKEEKAKMARLFGAVMQTSIQMAVEAATRGAKVGDLARGMAAKKIKKAATRGAITIAKEGVSAAMKAYKNAGGFLAGLLAAAATLVFYAGLAVMLATAGAAVAAAIDVDETEEGLAPAEESFDDLPVEAPGTPAEASVGALAGNNLVLNIDGYDLTHSKEIADDIGYALQYSGA